MEVPLFLLAELVVEELLPLIMLALEVVAGYGVVVGEAEQLGEV